MPRVRFRRLANGAVVGAIDIRMPHAPGAVTVAAVGDTKVEALGKAAAVADQVVNNPIVAALMPPQAVLAIKAAKGLAKAAKLGAPALKAFWGSIHGPGKQRLAVALHKEAVEQGEGAVGLPSWMKYAGGAALLAVNPAAAATYAAGKGLDYLGKKKKKARRQGTVDQRTRARNATAPADNDADDGGDDQGYDDGAEY